MFRYRIRELRYPKLPLWAATYTEFSAGVAAFILFEEQASCRLWALSRDLIEKIGRLNLNTVLGKAGNSREGVSLFDTIKH